VDGFPVCSEVARICSEVLPQGLDNSWQQEGWVEMGSWRLWLGHAVVFALVLAGPVWDYFEFKRLKASKDPRAKLVFYRKTLVAQWVMAAVVLVAVGRGIFQAPPQWEWMRSSLAKTLAITFSIGLIAALAAPFAALKRPKGRAAIEKAFLKLRFFLPGRPEEYGMFSALCVTAGICEEWICRGFLFRYFGAWPAVDGVFPPGTAWPWGLIAAFVISAVIFGANHFYQGVGGVIQTTVLGAVFGLLYLWTGSLLVPMIVHAAIDLRALALIMGIDTGEGESGVEGGS
jgi:membrane protease YdiL (CAAX protease family)